MHDSGTAAQKTVLFDASRVARLLALLADDSANGRGEQRLRSIGKGLADVIDADGWFWARGHTAREPAGQVLTDVIDGGFDDDAARGRFVDALQDPAMSAALFSPWPSASDACGEPTNSGNAGVAVASAPSIVTRPLDDRLPAGSPLRERWVEATGFDHGFLCEAPTPGATWITAGFLRRPGREEFSGEDRCAAHLVMIALGVIGRPAAPDESSDTSEALADFRPRERQVLVYLIAGDSAKEIGRKMNLSYHTITDYTKQIYKRLGVRSRPELLRRFLA